MSEEKIRSCEASNACKDSFEVLPRPSAFIMLTAWHSCNNIQNQKFLGMLGKCKHDLVLPSSWTGTGSVWMLNPQTFNYLDKRFGPHDIEACAHASKENNQVSCWDLSKEASCPPKTLSDFKICCHPSLHHIDKVMNHYLSHIDDCQMPQPK